MTALTEYTTLPSAPPAGLPPPGQLQNILPPDFVNGVLPLGVSRPRRLFRRWGSPPPNREQALRISSMRLQRELDRVRRVCRLHSALDTDEHDDEVIDHAAGLRGEIHLSMEGTLTLAELMANATNVPE